MTALCIRYVEKNGVNITSDRILEDEVIQKK
jgi:hypothetical protein